MVNIRSPKLLSCLMPLLVALLFSSCQVATPASRIEENPVLFSSLPVEEKLLVQQGQIRAGMSTGAVFLAWGYPNSRPFVGEKDGKRLERWVYTRLEPVMLAPTWGGACWGPRGHCHPSMGMDTAYVPRNTAEVVFEDGKVVSWEARM